MFEVASSSSSSCSSHADVGGDTEIIVIHRINAGRVAMSLYWW